MSDPGSATGAMRGADEEASLRARITATRWPDQELVGDFSQGVQQPVMQELARY